MRTCTKELRKETERVPPNEKETKWSKIVVNERRWRKGRQTTTNTDIHRRAYVREVAIRKRRNEAEAD